jgi:hypothetical protein
MPGTSFSVLSPIAFIICGMWTASVNTVSTYGVLRFPHLLNQLGRQVPCLIYGVFHLVKTSRCNVGVTFLAFLAVFPKKIYTAFSIFCPNMKDMTGYEGL